MSAGCSPTLTGCWRSSSASSPAPIEMNSTRAQPSEQVRTRLDRLARADQRLVDAYQAEAISLAELAERRRSLAGQRHALERQHAAAARSYAASRSRHRRC